MRTPRYPTNALVCLGRGSTKPPTPERVRGHRCVQSALRRLLFSEPSETLRDQTFLGEQSHKSDGQRGFISILAVNLLICNVFAPQPLGVRNLASGDLAEDLMDSLRDLLRIHIRILLLMVPHNFVENG